MGIDKEREFLILKPGFSEPLNSEGCCNPKKKRLIKGSC